MHLQGIESSWTFDEWNYHAASLRRELLSLCERVPQINEDQIGNLQFDFSVAEDRIFLLADAEFEGGDLPADLRYQIRELQGLANRVASEVREFFDLEL
ncbi:MAG: hypothetical protein K1X28_02520 [Parachlamydiales bacterium]|nr:hypothetical protein [Parachlamydiales bacterium]